MNQVQQQQLKRRVKSTVSDIDELQAQLAVVRSYCSELAASMRQIREDSIRAQQVALQRQERQNRRNKIKLVS